MASMRRWKQLTGPNNKAVAWALGSTLQYTHTDIPIKSQICGKKYVSAVHGVKLTYRLQLTNTDAVDPHYYTRDLLMNLLISQVQVDGSAMGTIISAAHMKPGIIDTVDFICNGGHMEATPEAGIMLAPSASRDMIFEVYLPYGFYGVPSPFAMAPMTSFVRPANLSVFAPTSNALAVANNAALSGYGGGGAPIVTASAQLIWKDEITVGPGFQMTRFKSTATGGTSSDTVDLKSFGQNSSLTGVEQRAAIAALLWASSLLSGDGHGAGLVDSVTDLSALFAGIEQTNDILPIIMQLHTEYNREGPRMNNDFGIPGTAFPRGFAFAYPLFTAELNTLPDATYNPAVQARFLPIFPPRKKTQISKMPIADGSPSYQMTVTNTNADHYSYFFGLYRWQETQFTALLEILKHDDIGGYLYGSNDLTDLVKLSKKNDAAGVNFSKTSFLPRKLLPVGFVEK